MDFFTKHLAAHPRKFPSTVPLITMGDVKDKDHWVKRIFETCNFSLILSGDGEYHRKGKVWKVEAPCVITQWPGEKLYYGPYKIWDEIFLIYQANSVEKFRKLGLIDFDLPVWPIRNIGNVAVQVDELRQLVRKPGLGMNVDRIDRVCERLVLETLMPEPGPQLDDSIIEEISMRVREQLQGRHDFDEIARKHGMSPSTFRRRWYQALGITPGRYLLNLRIHKARRLLAETTLQVGQIAEQTGFEDMLYFSKRFKLETQLTPSEYRRRYRIR